MQQEGLGFRSWTNVRSPGFWGRIRLKGRFNPIAQGKWGRIFEKEGSIGFLFLKKCKDLPSFEKNWIRKRGRSELKMELPLLSSSRFVCDPLPQVGRFSEHRYPRPVRIPTPSSTILCTSLLLRRRVSGKVSIWSLIFNCKGCVLLNFPDNRIWQQGEERQAFLKHTSGMYFFHNPVFFASYLLWPNCEDLYVLPIWAATGPWSKGRSSIAFAVRSSVDVGNGVCVQDSAETLESLRQAIDRVGGKSEVSSHNKSVYIGSDCTPDLSVLSSPLRPWHTLSGFCFGFWMLTIKFLKCFVEFLTKFYFMVVERN
jgi:hypothetical protein